MLDRALRRSLGRPAIRHGLSELAEVLGSRWALTDEQGELLEGDAAVVPQASCPVPGWPQLRLHAPCHGAALACALTSLLALETERKSLTDEALARYRELNLLYRIHERIGQSTERTEVLQSIVDEAARLVPGTRAALLLASADGLELQPLGTGEACHQGWLPAASGIAGACFSRWQASVINDVRGCPDYVGETSFASLLVAPMGSPERRLGVLMLGSRQADAFHLEQLKLFVTLASHGAIVLENLQLFDKLREALTEAQIASRAKDSFLRNMGHELRTPLHVIMGHGQILEMSNLDETGQESAKEILQASRQLLELLNDILDIARRDDEDDKPGANFIVQERLTDSLLAWRRSAEEKGLTLEASVDPALPPVLFGDERRIRQVLRHLCSNAVKFSEKGRIRLSAASVEQSGSGILVRFTVEDQGIGIAPEQHTQIFACFEQGDGATNRRFGGTGLGLAVCKYLVERMGGRLGLESAPGQGSRFWFETWLGRDDECPVHDA